MTWFALLSFFFILFSSFYSLDVISDAIMLIYRVHLMGSFFDSLPFSFYMLWSQGDINEIFSSGLYWSWKMNLFLFTRPSFDIIYNGYNVYHKKKKEVMKVIIFCGYTKKILYSFSETEIFPFQLVQFILIQFFRSEWNLRFLERLSSMF